MKIYSKLIKVQNELKAPKSQFNTFGKYNYRSCEDILEALKPVLSNNGLTVYISDDVLMVSDRVYVRATVNLVDIDTGESIQATALAREEETKKGMDGSQITGTASSYARKYALNGMFCIDDTKDSDATNDHGKGNEEVKTLSEAQIKRLYAIAKSKNITPQQVIEVIKKEYSIADPKQLNKQQYDALCERIEKK